MSDVILAEIPVTEATGEGEFDVFESLDVLEMTMDILRQHAAMVKQYGVFALIIITLPASKIKTDHLAAEIAEQVNRHSPQHVEVDRVGEDFKFFFHHT